MQELIIMHLNNVSKNAITSAGCGSLTTTIYIASSYYAFKLAFDLLKYLHDSFIGNPRRSGFE